MVGVICPHEGGFAIKVTEKIEDLVSALFLPLYFALSGLSTNLGLLDSGVTWGYVIAIIVLAFAGKIIGGTLAAKACKLVWRESFSIGVLMSCKGLVELIVLVSSPRSPFGPWLTGVEHRTTSSDSFQENLYHVCRYGTRYYSSYDPINNRSVPTMVPEKVGGVEEGRNRLGRKPPRLRRPPSVGAVPREDPGG